MKRRYSYFRIINNNVLTDPVDVEVRPDVYILSPSASDECLALEGRDHCVLDCGVGRQTQHPPVCIEKICALS